MLEIGLPRLRMSRGFLEHQSRTVSRFSRGPVAGNHRQQFFGPTGSQSPTGSKKRFFSIQWTIVIYLTKLDRKVPKVLSCNWASREAGHSSGQILRKLRLILRQEIPISNIFGAKAHANVLKGTFSTDCKSNCIRIGLRTYLAQKSTQLSKFKKYLQEALYGCRLITV